jgi:hypothetical protein
VVGLVAVAQAAQDLDGVVDGRFGDQDGLEAAGQRRVLLDVLAVLLEVVAPMMCNSPRARAGLSMLPASIEPPSPPPPAPTTVCNSSMNTISSSLCSRISSTMFVSRSSKSPRYGCPATTPARSSATTRLPARVRHVAVDDALGEPSTTAVLPTPASPIRTGLFLPRRDSTSMVCSISSSRPITGSIRPAGPGR